MNTPTQIIYQKKYCMDDILSMPENASADIPDSPKAPPTLADFGNYLASIELVPIPERVGKEKEFIETAIEIAQIYMLDIVLTRRDSHISAEFSFDYGPNMKHIKPVLMLADDFSFYAGINGREMTLCLDYYTHYVCRGGKIIEP